MRRRLALVVLSSLLAGGAVLASGRLPWEEQTESDWIYPLATRFAVVDGRNVHYPTPTAELAKALEARSDAASLRYLADARRELGDRPGAVEALEKWAEAEGPGAWDEAARWGAEYLEMGLAFRAAERALPGLPPEERRALADERIRWADAHPEAADPLALRQARAAMFPDDARALEDWIRALEKAGRLDDAEAALRGSRALTSERRLLLRSDLQADHGNHRRAFEILDEAFASGDAAVEMPLAQAYARRVDRGSPGSPEAWRSALLRSFDAAALVRLATVFQGQGRGEAAADLLRQVERRYEAQIDRKGWLLLERLHSAIDAVPEAFRDRLAAARAGTPAEQADDLAPLARLSLGAGGRPLAWGTYNDEPYRWVARVDRTPGFWTGGLSFLLTGQDWKDALARLEAESLPERTFATARALVDELARRAPSHEALPSLHAAVMQRHVERGEGREALALLPILESATPEVADAARRTALLAMRQVDVPLAEELRLYRARLLRLAPDGSRPAMEKPDVPFQERSDWNAAEPWRRPPPLPEAPAYRDVLDEAVSRIEQRDPSHRAAIDLILGEMDRMPDAEALWADLAQRLESWNLDDDLGPRYERALARFQRPGIWTAAARWYARRSRHRDLERLAGEIASRFRDSEVLGRVDGGQITLPIPEQPSVGARVRLVPWADWVRFKALQRFPHSPLIFREALSHLQSRGDWERELARRGAARLAREKVHRVVADDALLEDRRAALLFVDPERREEWMAERMRDGTLETRLAEMEARGDRTPVEDLLLFDGWSRLSRFERASDPGDRLAATYPGDGVFAGRLLSLHRSLAGLDTTHAGRAHEVAERAAPTLADPTALLTNLGELEEEGGRPERATPIWRRIVERDPRNADRIAELAAILWDYGHMTEALSQVEAGRKRLGRPRFLAFEAGVLREENHDIAGAIDEYLAALWPEEGDCFCSAFERDQRSLRRLSQLLGRDRVRRLVQKRLDALRPGVRADEEALAALYPLATITPPEPGLAWDADDWIDAMDMPNDAMGRAQREAARGKTRGTEEAGVVRIGDALLQKTKEMVPSASAAEFLDAADRWAGPFLDARVQRDEGVAFKSAVMARRSALAPSEEDRIAREVERARYLAENGRRDEADALWKSLAGRISALPEGAARMHAEADHAAYLERAEGTQAAAAAWEKLGARYPWSLGLLEDRLAFLARNGRGDEGRRVLEAVIPRAAPGRREALLQRLTQEALDAHDLAQARRAVQGLLEGTLDEGQRLAAVHLLARLSFKENVAFDPEALVRGESGKLRPDLQADLYQQIARAAGAEQAWGTAVGLWIEALNRRLERAWIAEGCRAADRAGQAKAFLEFFEKQRQRSPRDVRWAVAVREIRRHADDLEGAIEMAKTAVTVRPEREALWREATDLMVRAGRVREAADFLEGWNAPRPADESAARWRGELYARAGDGDKALSVERAALEAYRREAPLDETRKKELEERRARAARRLLEYGHPGLSWRLLAPDGDAGKVAASALADSEQADLALANETFLRLLRHRSGDADFRRTAGRALAERGRPEQRDEARAWILRQLYTEGTAAAAAGSDDALDRWWPFVQEASMEVSVREAIAGRVIASTPGPWQADATTVFVESVGASAVVEETQPGGERRLVFRHPALEPLFVRDLVRRDRAADLGAFLETRWRALTAESLATTPLPAGDEALPWAGWLADRQALETLARHLSTQTTATAELGRVFGKRRSWDRFWALAARRWDVAPLVAILPEDARVAWFRFWTEPASAAADLPVLRARRDAVERAERAVGRLVAGAPAAATDPTIVKLRGPRTVGQVLGTDAAWLWSEFVPRKDGSGAVVETGDHRIVGQGVDAGRLPGALWGERPGEAWYVLETLARFREGDAAAALVPFESPQRGRETERSLLGVRLALAAQDTPLALDVADEHPGRADDPAWREAHLRLLVGAGRTEKALEVLRGDVRKAQASMNDAGLRALEAVAKDLGLDAPLDLMDPTLPVSPALLAYLRDRRGDVAGRFSTTDAPGFRAALASRWTERERELSAAQVRYYLTELWAQAAAPLPRQGLARLGGLWPAAADWLDRQRVSDRAAALAAVDALPDPARFEALAAAQGEKDDVVRLLETRIHLARGEDAEAMAILDGLLSTLGQAGAAYSLAAAPAPAPRSEEEELEEAPSEGGESSPETEEADPVASRLATWLLPYQEAGRVPIVADRFRTLLAEKRAEGRVPIPSWRLAFELAPPDARAALLGELEHAWIRGDWPAEGLAPVAEVVARFAPAETPRWLGRWTERFGYDDTARRARVLLLAKDTAGAARVLADARPRAAWSRVEEVRAFDLWRSAVPWPLPKNATASAPPAAWAEALPFWKKDPKSTGPALLAYMRAHPEDLRAARAAVRTAAPGEEEPLRRAAAALEDPAMQSLGEPGLDVVLLQLRIARGLLPESWRAARTALGSAGPAELLSDLRRRRMRRAEIDEALADVTRIAARSADTRAVDEALAALTERGFAGLGSLRTEVAQARRPEGPPTAFHVVNGRPAPYRPRDLDWRVLASVLDSASPR